MNKTEKRQEEFMKSLFLKTDKVHRNLPVASLVETVVKKNEGMISSMGAISVVTGQFTGRSPMDRYIVDDELTHNTVDWGKVNRPISEEKFERILDKMIDHMRRAGKDLFIFDGFVGADPDYRVPVRIINDHAWQNMFSRQIFINPTAEKLKDFKREFVVVDINDFKANPRIHGTNTETFIMLSFKRKIALIANTSYAGEIKKSVFSAMNYHHTEGGILPMHCSANMGDDGDVTLFFGLSGTGKTVLSSDPERRLIGDDEHGWSDKGIFNFEAGCYAKCINLEKESAPAIWNAIKFGAILENVVLDANTRTPNFADSSLTENTRVAYPIDYVDRAVIPGIASHPRVIIFLTADAFGVMPPISRLTNEGAVYHFMSGYTSKLADTERGVTIPEATFSHCFAAPFMPRPAELYAKMFGEKIEKHRTRVYLVNTGWIGGPYGVGKRIELRYTRAMVSAAIKGEIERSKFMHHDVFNLDIPTSCLGVPSEMLNPSDTWNDINAYFNSARKLARLFIVNFSQFKNVPREIIDAGPSPHS